MNERSSERLSAREVIEWLQLHQPFFTAELERFGEMWDGRGKDQKRVPPFRGQYTGEKLCSVAVGVMDEALRRKYSEKLEIRCDAFGAYIQDEQVDDLNLLRIAQPHHHIRFRPRDSNSWFIADPTYRQFNIDVDPNVMIIGAPLNMFQKFYGINPEDVRTTLRSGYIFRQYLNLIEMGDLDGVKRKDYLKLLSVFS